MLVATTTYEDPDLRQLVSPARDAAALAEVLGAADVGGFEVSTVVDATAAEISASIDDFVAERERGDLLLLYLSCHGLKDEQGRLYFAARNTRRDRLRSTAVAAGFVNDILFTCRSRRKVLLLDCCYSGAFAKGLAVKADDSVHTADHFDARGLVVLTASDATQYAFEGDAVTGVAAPSLFTASVADGLRTGAADVDGDGLVSVDDVYEYARRRLRDQPRPQSPRKWEFDVAGSIVLARAARSPASTGPAGSAGARAEASTSVPVSTDLPTVLAKPVAPEATSVVRAQQGVWWLAVLAFLVTAAAASVLLVLCIESLFIHPVVGYEPLPGRESVLVAAGSGGAVWALVYAAVDASARTPARWYSLHLQWGAWLTRLLHPAGVAGFLRAARAAVPLNVAVTVLVSLAAASVAFAWSGSEARNNTFQITYILLTAVPVTAHLVRGRSVPD
jgi:hypothetical protein